MLAGSCSQPINRRGSYRRILCNLNGARLNRLERRLVKALSTLPLEYGAVLKWTVAGPTAIKL